MTVQEKTVKVCIPDDQCEPFYVRIKPTTMFCSLLYSILRDYTHTICCLPYIKLGDKQITLLVRHDAWHDVHEINKLVRDRPMAECEFENMNVYDNITEIGAYWT